MINCNPMTLIVDLLMKRPTTGDVVSELALFAAPLCVAALAGLVLGWAWRPEWALNFVHGRAVACSSSADESEKVENCVAESDRLAVAEEDLERLCRLTEETDGGPAWNPMMDKSIPNFCYQAWRRDPENGPTEYRSRTVFEDATPEMVRDFFWDDEFRIENKWDDMLLHHETLEECPTTGTMVVQWIRKFPFFCSDREYIIGRRIWLSGGTFYCVTKGVPCPSVPRQSKPRRVDLYYSSWCIRAVESRRGDGQLTACEVLLFHQEDMGIPRDIAKMGIRQGMWGCVKRLEPGLRAYQMARMSCQPLSHCAAMAQINTKVSADHLSSFETSTDSSDIVEPEKEKHWMSNVPKLLMIGGAVAFACTLDHGLVTKAVIFGIARRFGNPGKRL